MARGPGHSKHWGGNRPGAGRPLLGSPTQRISITIPEDLIQKIDQEAYRHNCSRSAMITQYLLQAREGNQTLTTHSTQSGNFNCR